MYVYKSVAESRVANAHHIIHSALTGITQPSGAATPRNSDAHERIAVPQALCVLLKYTQIKTPKPAKFAVLTPDPGMFVNVRNAPRVVIAPSTQNATCFAVCALVCDG